MYITFRACLVADHRAAPAYGHDAHRADLRTLPIDRQGGRVGPRSPAPQQRCDPGESSKLRSAASVSTSARSPTGVSTWWRSVSAAGTWRRWTRATSSSCCGRRTGSVRNSGCWLPTCSTGGGPRATISMRQPIEAGCVVHDDMAVEVGGQVAFYFVEEGAELSRPVPLHAACRDRAGGDAELAAPAHPVRHRSAQSRPPYPTPWPPPHRQSEAQQLIGRHSWSVIYEAGH